MPLSKLYDESFIKEEFVDPRLFSLVQNQSNMSIQQMVLDEDLFSKFL